MPWGVRTGKTTLIETPVRDGSAVAVAQEARAHGEAASIPPRRSNPPSAQHVRHGQRRTNVRWRPCSAWLKQTISGASFTGPHSTMFSPFTGRSVPREVARAGRRPRAPVAGTIQWRQRYVAGVVRGFLYAPQRPPGRCSAINRRPRPPMTGKDMVRSQHSPSHLIAAPNKGYPVHAVRPAIQTRPPET